MIVAAFLTGLYEHKSRASTNAIAAAVDWLFFERRSYRHKKSALTVQNAVGVFHRGDLQSPFLPSIDVPEAC